MSARGLPDQHSAMEYRRQLAEASPPMTLEKMKMMIERKREEQDSFVALFRKS